MNLSSLHFPGPNEAGSFDIIGDIHGCYVELFQLLQKLGYSIQENKIQTDEKAINPPAGRYLIFLGDLVDRGPESPSVLALVMNAVKTGVALCLLGNHEAKFLKYLQGRNVQLKHGLDITAEQMQKTPAEFKQKVITFLESLPYSCILDRGNLVVAHAGLSEALQGKTSKTAQSFAIYGDVAGMDKTGMPIRRKWPLHYQGKRTVVYGHTPTPEAKWINNTICIDTGCVFGGQLTALRYPERELVSVRAQKVYCNR